mgnify:CR=1 FL=1
MNIRRFSSIYWCFILSLQFLNGANDFESRNTISFQFKLPHSFRLDCEQSLRLSGQELEFKQTFTELTFSKEIINDLKVFIPIRYAIFDDKVKNRMSLGGIYKIAVKSFKFKYKTRFQRTHEKSKNPEDLFRNKFYAHYKLSKKFEPFISCEIFHPANSNDNELNEYRLSLGTDFDLPRKKALKLYYQYKVEDLNKKSADETHIIGLSFSFN